MRPHIHLTPNPSYARVIVCGSPERAEIISRFLDGGKQIAKNREYHSYLGKYQGAEILVTSHGVGSAGAAICFQELMDVGAKAVIRIGTAGGLYDESQIGDIVVPTAAIRRDGVTSLMVPTAYPAIPSMDMTTALLTNLDQSTQGQSSNTHRAGIILTSDLFYPGLLEDELALYQKANAVAVEMECSTLFVIGLLRKVDTAALLVLDGNPLKWAHGHYDPNPKRLQASVETCIQAALLTLATRKI